MGPLSTKIGDKLRRLARAKGYTQEGLAKTLGVAQGTIGNYFSGKGLDLDTAKELAEIIGEDLIALLREEMPLNRSSEDLIQRTAEATAQAFQQQIERIRRETQAQIDAALKEAESTRGMHVEHLSQDKLALLENISTLQEPELGTVLEFIRRIAPAPVRSSGVKKVKKPS